ncbi:MAG: metal-dependent transcriptional regulator [Spirochaetales bacterium]|nr:metal-dependent transcriptional regulator [Spirochaetales bacterium]
MNNRNLTPSLEDYLETILRLERKNRVARVKDIAALLDVQMPSVTGALKNLRTRGLVNYEKNSYISLTDEGMGIAKSVEGKHELLVEFLNGILLVPLEDAEEEACEIEHVISKETASKLKKMTNYLQNEIFNNNNLSSDEWKKIIT